VARVSGAVCLTGWFGDGRADPGDSAGGLCGGCWRRPWSGERCWAAAGR